MSQYPDASIVGGYAVEPAGNGGWIVRGVGPAYMQSSILGAFTNATDLLSFLTEEHTSLSAQRASLELEEDKRQVRS